LNPTQTDLQEPPVVTNPFFFEGPFIGRKKQIQEVESLLEDARLVTVFGAGGIGKTRLVAEIIARRMRNELKSTSKTVVASLASVTEATENAVLDAIASGFRINSGSPAGIRESLVEKINSAPTLLVIDNCETARISTAQLVDQLLKRCQHLQVLTTSQHVLGLQRCEKAFPLSPLSIPGDNTQSFNDLASSEGHQLFVTRAQMARSSWKLEEWVPDGKSEADFRQILQLTSGIPLAIELVAAWAPFESVSKILEGLCKTPLGQFTTQDDYNAPDTPRHDSMLHCMEWSYKHLAGTFPREANGFMQLGVFSGKFTADAVKKICGIDNPLKTLTHLVKTSLLQCAPGTNPLRYHMLCFTRTFANDKAEEKKITQDLLTRHLDYYAILASSSAQPEDTRSVEVECPECDWPDLVVAANTAYSIRKFHIIWKISKAIGPFLQQRGLWSEREKLARLAVSAASKDGHLPAFRRTSIDLGRILEARGEREAAGKQYLNSWRSAKKNHPKSLNHEAIALQHLGALFTLMGDQARADRAAAELCNVTRLLENPRARAQSLDKEGKMLQKKSAWKQAKAKYVEALRIREELGDEEGLARSCANLGSIYSLQRDFRSAEAEFRKALKYWHQHEILREQAITLYMLADLFRRQWRYPEARELAEESLSLRDDEPKGQVYSLILLSKILAAQKDADAAITTLSKCLQVCRGLGDEIGHSIALNQLGAIYSTQENWEAALQVLQDSKAILEKEPSRDIIGLGITLDRIGQIHVHRCDWTQAEAALNESLEYSQQAGRTVQAALTMMNLAMMYAAKGDKEKALEGLDKTITSLAHERAGSVVLQEARKVHAWLSRKMREGSPWTHWRNAAFKTQSIFIRKKYDPDRRAGRWTAVIDGYMTLAENFHDKGLQMEQGLSLNQQGAAHRHLNEFDEAELVIRCAMAIFEDINLPLGVADSWHKLGDVYVEKEQWEEAEEAFGKSISLKHECFDDEGEAISQDALAKVLIQLGRLKKAEAVSKRSWEIMKEIGTAKQKWFPLFRLLWFRIEAGDLSGAQALTELMVKTMRGKPKHETTANELQKMATSADWDGVKERLASEGICGPISSPADDSTGVSPTSECSLCRRGSQWEIRYLGTRPFYLKDQLGVRYLATLLGSPNQSMPCSVLASQEGRAVVTSQLNGQNDPLNTSKSKKALRDKLDGLYGEIKAYKAGGNPSMAIELEDEVEKIKKHLKDSHDRLGNDHSLTDGGEKCRKAVGNAITRALKKLREDSQTTDLGIYLTNKIKPGYSCTYSEDPHSHIHWRVEP